VTADGEIVATEIDAAPGPPPPEERPVERRPAAPASPPTSPGGRTRAALREMLGSPAALRQALLVREVLGPPVSMRPPGSGPLP